MNDSTASDRCQLQLRLEYDVVRRAIAYLAGTLVLARQGCGFRSEVHHDAVRALASELHCVGVESRGVALPEPWAWRRQVIVAAAARTASAAATITAGLSAHEDGLLAGERAFPLLESAYELLRAAHDQDSGLLLIDLGHACAHSPSRSQLSEESSHV